MSNTDLIDDLLGIVPGSHLDLVRRHRSVARDNIQRAYDALFEPVDASQLSVLERAAIASFVASLHRQPHLSAHYAEKLAEIEGGKLLSAVVEDAVDQGATHGPYGNYPAGPLSNENQAGLHFVVSAAGRQTLGSRLSAAFDHAHLLVFRPRDASADAIAALSAAGFSTAAIVTLSQLVSYTAFQVRLIDGLAALAAATVGAEPAAALNA
ncbi:CMD domain protein [Devosia sp.]|uniref:CMD domain protein n=1 Tax=Devosia sp. TaxID=1871048 RepID=UPI001AD3402F|nr:CMD domain protein [Devosia sp.]MBN9333739.1 CMD domain protein [Devosia sp.]